MTRFNFEFACRMRAAASLTLCRFWPWYQISIVRPLHHTPTLLSSPWYDCFFTVCFLSQRLFDHAFSFSLLPINTWSVYSVCWFPVSPLEAHNDNIFLLKLSYLHSISSWRSISLNEVIWIRSIEDSESHFNSFPISLSPIFCLLPLHNHDFGVHLSPYYWCSRCYAVCNGQEGDGWYHVFLQSSKLELDSKS